AEWRTGRTAPCLSVLCLWNTRSLPASLLRQSWTAGRLTPAEQRAARAVLAGGPLPRALAARTGPPLVHPLDPRHEYRESEHRIMQDLRGLPAAGPPQTGEDLYVRSDPPALLRAAETHARYAVRRTHRKSRGESSEHRT
ncbi:MAG: hypothetical protein JW951_05280, partial [Lentisphaerae bacterium]|nr:hypothetical protein [Lentisphaerota bacterium]